MTLTGLVLIGNRLEDVSELQLNEAIIITPSDQLEQLMREVSSPAIYQQNEERWINVL